MHLIMLFQGIKEVTSLKKLTSQCNDSSHSRNKCLAKNKVQKLTNSGTKKAI